MRNYKIYFLVMMASCLMLASENDFLYIPCKEYKKGSTQNTHKESKNKRKDIVSVVKSKIENQILLIDKIKSSANGKSSFYSKKTILKKEGNTIFEQGQTIRTQGMTIEIENIPPIPICGKVPKNFIFTSISKNKYNTTEAKNTITIKKIGKKKIKVPAGDFETVVFQKKKKIDIINAAQTEVVSIEYVVENIGIIKKDSMLTIHMPNMPKEFLKNLRSNSVTELISYNKSSSENQKNTLK